MNTTTENSNFAEDDIVISGISGRFPNCVNIDEFKNKLMNGIDMVGQSTERWPVGFYGLPSRLGVIPNLTHFDAEFFGVHAQLAHRMDPQGRLVLEATFEALLDAGINPSEVRGTNTGVFIGLWENESNEFWKKDTGDISQNGLLGSSRNLLANRVSYEFDFCGPALCIDTACSSSLVTLHNAVSAIKTGQCDAAIVAGTNVCLLPQVSLQLYKLGVLSNRGWCNSFDSQGDGYVRSEAVVVLYLQRAHMARRIYASVLGSKVNSCGYTGQGLTHPSSQMQLKLVTELYKELKINVSDVAYIETHGTGTRVGDVEETDSLVRAFCQNREGPLRIGSVKSNMGHSESTSGLCSVAKVVIAMENGVIPKNLHYTEPNAGIQGLRDGSLKVISQNEPWNVGIVGINSTGIGGTNSHVVLRPNTKPKAKSHTNTRLIIASGRTEESVTHLLNQLEKYEDDTELQALTHKIFCNPVKGHDYRGYKILGDSNSEISKIKSDKRTVWFVYTGMGSQWTGMAKKLMEFETFRDSIQLCADVLQEVNVNLKDLLLNADDIALQDAANAFICIISVEIALTDVLKSVKIEPDGIIGHSLGELACGYCDGSLTRYQAIMAAYLRGMSFKKQSKAQGRMASVGLTWEECAKRCPAQVFLACHNGKDNVTVAGRAEAVEKFVLEMQSKNIFARMIKNVNYAFHTKYLNEVGTEYLEKLQTIVQNPKLRSSKWLSTSVSEASWGDAFAKTCSADYLVNNIRAPVLFYETLRHVPEDAIIIEIAPHGLLKSILKRSVGPKCDQFSLMHRDHPNNLHMLMSTIGKMYNAGLQPEIFNMYKPVTFPVGRGTPMISPFVKWNHSKEWDVAKFSKNNANSGEEVFTIDITSKEDKYLLGHCIDGRVLFPAAGYIVLAWKALAKLLNEDFEKVSVVIKNIKFHSAVVLTDKPTKFLVNILKGTGEFQICEKGIVVASGTITVSENPDQEMLDLQKLVCDKELITQDVYTELHMRGYMYSGLFKGITESGRVGGKVQWNNNWVALIDTMQQFLLLAMETRELYLPTKIQSVIINPNATLGEALIPVYVYPDLGVVMTNVVEIRKVSSTKAQRARQDCKPRLERYQFIALTNNAGSVVEALTVLTGIILENVGLNGTINIFAFPTETCLGSTIKSVLEVEPRVTVNYTNVEIVKPVTESTHLVILSDVLKHADALKAVSGFILSEEAKPLGTEDTKRINLEIISTQTVDTVFKTYVLLRRTVSSVKNSVVVQVSNTHFEWLSPIQAAIQNSNKIYLVAQDDAISGLIGLVNCLVHEIGSAMVRCFFLQNQEAKTFSLDCPFYRAQIEKDLVCNVLGNYNTWGTFRYLPLDVSQEEHVDHAFIAPGTKGDLGSLRWVESPLGYHIPSNTLERCIVHYASLNFRDVLLATGKLSPNIGNDEEERESFLGFEFAGRDSSGRRVMGMLSEGALATTCELNSELLQEVPQHWSLEQAATVPLAYATCYYAMVLRGQIQPGESILIHAGAGGVGQAAISIALHTKCTVFTTVGSQVKREFLIKKFQQIKIDHIGNSRDTTFEQMVMVQTNGTGVDLVLNCLTGDKLLASVRCLAKGGRFLELGKMDMLNHQTLELETFLDNRAFIGVALDEIIRTNIPLVKRINKLIAAGIATGAVVPLSTEVFTKHRVKEAFKLMASGQHIGKVLIKIRENEGAKQICPVVAASRTYMKPDKSYIIIGGLGSIGLELTNWLVVRGATKIIISSRYGIKTGYQRLCLRRWAHKRVTVIVVNWNAAIFEEAVKLLEEAKLLGPVGGIFNLAMVREDALIQNQTQSNFALQAQTKIETTKNLNVVSRTLNPNLEYFVVFSSFACGRGHAGQSSYAFANSAMERICEQRFYSGLPALAIQWGPVGDVGYFANNNSYILDIVPQKISSCLSTLDIFMKTSHPVVSSFILVKQLKEKDVSKTTAEETIAILLGIKDISKVNRTLALIHLGMDSLLAVDIKVELEKNYNLILTTREIQSLTFERLRELTAANPVESRNTGQAFCFHACQDYGVGDACKFLTAPVYNLYITQDIRNESIKALAEYYVQKVKEVHPGPYVLIGYSLSACVVFETGLRLQSQNCKVSLIFIQSSHVYLAPGLLYKNMLENQAKSLVCYPGFCNNRQMNLIEKLSTLATLDERILYATNILQSRSSVLNDEIKKDIYAFWRIATSAAVYEPSNTFKGDVILIKSRSEDETRKDTYELEPVCEKPIEVHELDNQDIQEKLFKTSYINEIIEKLLNT